MPDLPDSTPIKVRCPRCGKRNETSLGWAKANRYMACQECGAAFPLNHADLAEMLGQMATAGAPATGPKPKKPRRDQTFLRSCLVILIGLALVEASQKGYIDALIRLAGQPPAVPTPTAPAAPPMPAAAHIPPTAFRTPTCAFTPVNGQVLRSNITDYGLHRITIENGSDGNAIVILRDAVTNKLVLSFFVSSGASAFQAALPDGRYRLQWAIGGDLAADCRSFVRTEGISEFTAIQNMVTRPIPGGLSYRDDTVTLYAVPGGNLDSHPIDAKDFYAN